MVPKGVIKKAKSVFIFAHSDRVGAIQRYHPTQYKVRAHRSPHLPGELHIARHSSLMNTTSSDSRYYFIAFICLVGARNLLVVSTTDFKQMKLFGNISLLLKKR